MASDLEAVMLEEEEALNTSGVRECLVRWDMEMVTLGSGGGVVNDADAISATLAREVKSKAFRLLVDYKKPGFSSVKAGHGQASFIRREKIGASPGGLKEYAVVPVTAKHNIRRYAEYYAQANPKMLIDGPGRHHVSRLKLDEYARSPDFASARKPRVDPCYFFAISSLFLRFVL
jgi:hypothetical protein